jgi:putative glutamine transport system substrate-binding protein
MRIFYSLLLQCFFIGALSAQGTTGESWKNVKQKGSGTLYLVYSEFPSFCFKTKEGNYEGVDVGLMKDFVEYVKKAHNVTLQIKYIDKPDGSNDYNHIKNSTGGVICIVDFVRTKEREKEVDFSQTFDYSYDLLVTGNQVADLSDIKNIGKEFPNFTAYSVVGTIQEKRLKEIKTKYAPQWKLSLVADYKALQNAVIKDPNGLAYLDSYAYLEILRKKVGIKHHTAATIVSDESAFIMPKGSDWIPVFNEFLSANGGYRKSNEYKKLLLKYIGESGLRLLKLSAEK